MSPTPARPLTTKTRGVCRRGAAALAVAGAVIVGLVGPAGSQAATSTFGSPLTVPATLDTAHNLAYQSPHNGADTALWNVAQAQGAPQAPAAGQVLSVTVEGCAQPASNGPAPLTQIHFQSLTVQPDGSYRVNVTTQPFDLPICGVQGASGSTRTTYQPTNFCVAQGDYVDFNDAGGYDQTSYPSGVPYQVIGSVTGSTMDSHIGTNTNGSALSPSDATPVAGFARNANEEVMLQATLGTGPDATPLCPGGTAGQGGPGAGPGGVAGASVPAQRVRVNHAGSVTVAFVCKPARSCVGRVALTRVARRGVKALPLGSISFDVPAGQHARVRVHLTARARRLIRGSHRTLRALMSVVLSGGATVRQPITLTI